MRKEYQASVLCVDGVQMFDWQDAGDEGQSAEIAIRKTWSMETDTITVAFLASHPAQYTIYGHTHKTESITQWFLTFFDFKVCRLHFLFKVFKRLVTLEGTESCVWAVTGDVNIYHYLLSATNTVYNLQTVLWVGPSSETRSHKLFNDQNIAGDNFHLQFPQQPHTATHWDANSGKWET